MIVKMLTRFDFSAAKADLLLVLLDINSSEFLYENASTIDYKRTIFIQSKSDLTMKEIVVDGANVLRVSSQTGHGVPALISEIEKNCMQLEAFQKAAPMQQPDAS